MRHDALRTENAYRDWAKRFILSHGKRHPPESGAAEIHAFLIHLAVRGRVSASTQNQAIAALVFVYQKALEVEPERIKGVVRAQPAARLPVVLSRDEAARIIAPLAGGYRLHEPGRVQPSDHPPPRQGEQGAANPVLRSGQTGSSRAPAPPVGAGRLVRAFMRLLALLRDEKVRELPLLG
ncbi:MAG: phage integrase N-terminal SAM-like domain-containing protein, partial [Pirellulales bacterium]|nr:phage integrase N-terminal SAM-like domain-containing protein [Pirellulales bacterium]